MQIDKELHKAKRVVDSFIQEYTSGHPMFTDEDIDSLNWLISTLEGLKGEVERLKWSLSSHGPEGHNYTNAEYVRLLQERKAYKDALEIAMSQNQSPEVYQHVQKLVGDSHD